METTQVTISPISEADFPAWIDLWKKYQNFYETSIPEEVTRKTWARLLDADEPVYGAVARVDNRTVGFAHWVIHPSTWSTQSYAYMEDLFVDDTCRGAGIGRKLIEYLSAEAKQADCERVYWTTAESNVEAQKLYDKMGINRQWRTYKRDLAP